MIDTSTPSTDGSRLDPATPVILRLEDVSIVVGNRGGDRALVTGLDLEIDKGEVVGLVGESGSGKSISALACVGLLPSALSVGRGRILLSGEDVTHASEDHWRQLRGREVAMVFQDPMTSLDPCFRIGSQIVESIRAHQHVSREVAAKRAIDVLGHVGIADPARRFDAFPHELSGGLRQRVMIAAALVLEPKVLIADEPTTALDVTTQASIIELVKGLCAELSMSVLWISHDLAVVSELADRVAVTYAGELVEAGCIREVFSEARHHYTRGLLESAVHGKRGEAFGFISGSVPEPSDWSAGCRFGARCSRADEQCAQHPAMTQVRLHRMVRCHHPIHGAPS